MKRSHGSKKQSLEASARDSGIYQVLSKLMSGSAKIILEPGLSAYRLPDGTTLELYSEGPVYPDYLFSLSDLVVSYKVVCVERALAALDLSETVGLVN